MQSSRSSTPLKRGLWSATLHTIAKHEAECKVARALCLSSRPYRVRVPTASPVDALVVESADTLRSERSDASRAGASPAEGTNLVAEGEGDSPRAVTPL